MATNITGNVTVLPLTQASLKYKNEDQNFIHEKLSPAVQVQKRTAAIYSYGTDNMRIVNNLRSIGGNSYEVDTTVSKATHYSLEDHALHNYIPYEDYENAERPLNVQIDEVENLTEMLMVAKEKALADQLQSTTVITQNTTLAGTDQWSDYANSDPIGDITTGITTVRSGSGKHPNSLILAYDTFVTLLGHPDIKDLFPGAQVITSDMVEQKLPMLFHGIRNLYVGMGMYDSANKNATLSLSDIWTKTALVAYIEGSPKLKSRTLSLTYQKDSPRKVQMVKKNSNNQELVDRNADFIRVNDEYDQVIVDEKCAYLIDAAIA